jgi:hypothetical protein
MKKFQNLVYMTITDADFTDINIIHLKKLEEFFAKLNSADGLGRWIFLPPNMKQIVLYASEENYQEHLTQFSEGHIKGLGLYVPKCTELEFW